MDCDTAIHEFLQDSYVIERPASADLLADKAVNCLQKMGMKIEFLEKGKEQVRHDAIVSNTLPTNVSFISRASGLIKKTSDVQSNVLVAGPRLISNEIESPEPAVSMAHKTFVMVAKTLNETTDKESHVFAGMMTVKASKNKDVINYLLKDMQNTYGVTSDAANVLQNVSLNYDKMKSSNVFMNKDVYETFDTAKAFSRTIKNNLEYEKGLFADALNEKENIEGRFKIKPYTGDFHGPSYVGNKLNETSLKTIQGLHPDLLKVVKRASEISEVRFEVVPGTGGLRGKALQQKIKKAGASKAKTERHTIGYAIDITPVDKKGNITYKDQNGFQKISEAMQQAAEELNIPIEWGGNWRRFVDKPHFELDRVFYPAEGEGPDRRIKVEPYQISAAFR